MRKQLLQRVTSSYEHLATEAKIHSWNVLCEFAAIVLVLSSTVLSRTSPDSLKPLSYPVVHTGLVTFYSDKAEITHPVKGEPFYGQDADFVVNPASYTDNGDGTVSDNVTGLMWEKDMGEKMTLEQAQKKAKMSNLGGFTDWRVPTIKELYSLINFNGKAFGIHSITLFIDTTFFNQPLGDTRKGEREIDAQTWSATVYTGKTLNNIETIFGVNFIDGRIKGYPKYSPRTNEPHKMYFRLVRGNPQYGINNFVDNKNGTITDLATGLMWQKEDSKKGMDWEDALHYAETLTVAGYNDWRLPSAKELQSIVDYTRSPQSTQSAAIHPIFEISSIKDPRNRTNYPCFHTGTTHLDGRVPERNAVNICFGEALGKMFAHIIDVHGAGAQRSDPKSGNINDYPQYFGPQGDLRVVYNYVRCVRYAN